MKNRFAVLAALLLVLLSTPFALAMPQFSSNVTSKAQNIEYNYNNNYGFQINVTNGTVGGAAVIGNATFQLGRPGGTLTNYTNGTSGVTTFLNNSAGVFWVNFTQAQLGPAGTYNITWYANTTTNVSEVNSSTPLIVFVIATNTTVSNSLHISIDGSETNTTYDPTGPRTTNATGFTSPTLTGQTITLTLYRDSTSIGTGSSVEDVSNLNYLDNTYLYTYNGSNANYSLGTIQRTLYLHGGSAGNGGGSGAIGGQSSFWCGNSICDEDKFETDQSCPIDCGAHQKVPVSEGAVPILSTGSTPSSFKLDFKNPMVLVGLLLVAYIFLRNR